MTLDGSAARDMGNREPVHQDGSAGCFTVLYISQTIGGLTGAGGPAGRSHAVLEALHRLGADTTLAVEVGFRGPVSWDAGDLDGLAAPLAEAVRAADIRMRLGDPDRPGSTVAPVRRTLAVRWRDRLDYWRQHDQRMLVGNLPDALGPAPAAPALLRHVGRFSLERNLYSWAVARALDGTGPVEIDARGYDAVVFDAPHFIRPTGVPPERMLLILHDVVPSRARPGRPGRNDLVERQQGSALARNSAILFASEGLRDRTLQMFPHLSERALGVLPETEHDGGHRLDLSAAVAGVMRGAGLPLRSVPPLTPPSVPARAVPAIAPPPRLATASAEPVAARGVLFRPPAPFSVGFLILAGLGDEEALSATLRSLDAQAGTWTALVGRSEADLATQPLGERHRTVGVGALGPDRAGMGAAYRALLEASDHDHVAVLEPGDEVLPGAVETMAAEARDADVLYSDEALGGEGGPSLALKPGWSPDVLHAFNYLGRLTVIRRSLALEAGAFPPTVGAAAEWDCNLRVTARTDRIRRVPQVLCRRRAGSDLDRPAPDAPRSADQREALRAHWARLGVEAAVATQADGTQRATWPIPDPPLVSIIIPTRDKAHLLALCLDGLLHGTAYPNREIILVDNLSREPETHALYQELVSAGQARIVRFDRPFNYSAACNAGAAEARGELLLFLNNDIEITTPDWLDELVRYALQPGVGMVGTMLVYPNGVLQHAGAVYGLQLCGLIFRYGALDEWNIFGSPSTPRTYLSLMGACHLVRRDAFERVGGYDERYHLSGSDSAIGLRTWRAGYRTAYTPHARLIHHEGATRGPGNPWEDTVQLARDIRAVGLEEDPYHHPGLDPRHDLSILRESGQPTGAEYMRRHLGYALSRTPPATRLDIFNDLDVADALGLNRDEALWPTDGPEAFGDLWSAARFCIQLLRTRPDLRRRFPRALREGAGGAFHRWLVGEAAVEFALPTGAPAQIDQAFAADLSGRVVQRVLTDRDLLERCPLGLTPAGRRDLIGWLLGPGRSDHQLRTEEVWWSILGWDEDPRDGLELAWLFTPDWQRAFPTALTAYGWPEFAAWVARSFGVTETWLAPGRTPTQLTAADQLLVAHRFNEAWRRAHPSVLRSREAAEAWLSVLPATPSGPADELVPVEKRQAVADALARPGVALLAPFNHASEAQAGADALAAGLEQAGLTVGRRDTWVDERDRPDRVRQAALITRSIAIVHGGPERSLHDSYDRAGLAEPRPRPYRIGYWHLPSSRLPEHGPEHWAERSGDYDEIWVPFRSLAGALAPLLARPVLTMPPGVELPGFTARPRSTFGLAGSGLAVLSILDTRQDLHRQNPTGLIEAFRAAFPPGAGATLAIALQGRVGGNGLEEFLQAAHGAGAMVLQGLGPEEMLALVEGCDLYADLDRAPGFGLWPRRAMLLGTPVLATRSGGLLDVLTDQNGLPVEPLAEDGGPSIEHAAALMRRAGEDIAVLRDLGRAARAHMLDHGSLSACGQAAARRLTVIEAIWSEGRLQPGPPAVEAAGEPDAVEA